MRTFIYFVLFLLLFAGQPAFSQQDQAPQEQPQQDLTLPDGIMATRGAGSVSREMFDARVSRIPEKDREAFLRSGPRVEKTLADLLLTSQLKADAQAAGFDKGIMQYRMQLAADRELANAWTEHYLNSQPPADYLAMAKEYYLLNQEDMMTELSRDVTHLLVSIKDSTREEVEQQAQIYLDQVTQDPGIFDQLVMDHSEDPSVKTTDGHLMGIKKGDTVASFEKAAFALEAPGDISGLVQSNYGVHIIRLDKINPPQKLPFERVQKQLMEMKEKEHKDRVRYAYLNELGSMEWNVSREELQAMVDRYFDDEPQQEDSSAPESE